VPSSTHRPASRPSSPERTVSHRTLGTAVVPSATAPAHPGPTPRSTSCIGGSARPNQSAIRAPIALTTASRRHHSRANARGRASSVRPPSSARSAGSSTRYASRRRSPVGTGSTSTPSGPAPAATQTRPGAWLRLVVTWGHAARCSGVTSLRRAVTACPTSTLCATCATSQESAAAPVPSDTKRARSCSSRQWRRWRAQTRRSSTQPSQTWAVGTSDANAAFAGFPAPPSAGTDLPAITAPTVAGLPQPLHSRSVVARIDEPAPRPCVIEGLAAASCAPGGAG
jgi:hypothetical protein